MKVRIYPRTWTSINPDYIDYECDEYRLFSHTVQHGETTGVTVGEQPVPAHERRRTLYINREELLAFIVDLREQAD